MSNVQYLSNVECLILSVSCLVIIAQCPVSCLPCPVSSVQFPFSSIWCPVSNLVSYPNNSASRSQSSSEVPGASPQVPDPICLVSPQRSMSYSDVLSEILLISSKFTVYNYQSQYYPIYNAPGHHHVSVTSN